MRGLDFVDFRILPLHGTMLVSVKTRKRKQKRKKILADRLPKKGSGGERDGLN